MGRKKQREKKEVVKPRKNGLVVYIGKNKNARKLRVLVFDEKNKSSSITVVDLSGKMTTAKLRDKLKAFLSMG